MQTTITQKSVYAHCPRIVTHIVGLGKVPSGSGVTPTLIHLIKIRVSQLNGCAFCLNMHIQEARADGEQQARLDVLSAWRETECFSAQEQAALAWAEALTELSIAAVTAEIREAVMQAFGEKDTIELTTVILEINSWNRIAVGFHFTPDI